MVTLPNKFYTYYAYCLTGSVMFWVILFSNWFSRIILWSHYLQRLSQYNSNMLSFYWYNLIISFYYRYYCMTTFFLYINSYEFSSSLVYFSFYYSICELETWNYNTLWGIIILGNLPSFLFETIFLLKLYVYKITVY